MPADAASDENAYAVGLQACLWSFRCRDYNRTMPKVPEAAGVPRQADGQNVWSSNAAVGGDRLGNQQCF